MRYNKRKNGPRIRTNSFEEVIMQPRMSKHIDPALAFNLMKFAFQVFEKKVVELTIEEYAEAYQQACHEATLHEMILMSDAACGVVIPDKVFQATFYSLLAEHGSEEKFLQHLQKNNLQPDDYFTALHNDLKVEAVLARVAFHAAPVTDREIQDYYNLHQDSFCYPEQRSTRHILISTENRYSHLPKDSLLHRTLSLHSRLRSNPQTFTHEAQLHSDCTTAIDGGDLGRISPGELCAALDQALFQLAAGEISPVIQTPQGFHILFCEAIHAGQHLSLQEASHQIHQILTREKRILTCRTWLKSLFPNLKETHAKTC